MKLPVHRIIPFSNVEGQGNRTSIFVQGCNANCLYCHNSETIPMKGDESCIYTVDELLEVIKSNMPFIRGITVSGGEATLYHGFLTELFKRVHEMGLDCYVDSNGFFDAEEIGSLIDETDKFLIDIKGSGLSLETLCFSDFLHEGSSIAKDHLDRFVYGKEHFKNLDVLIKRNKVEEVRLVFLKGYYDAESVMDEISESLKHHPGIALKLIRVHDRGLKEERALKIKDLIPTESELDDLAEYGKMKGLTNIIKIY